jgi:hypothetical protein
MVRPERNAVKANRRNAFGFGGCTQLRRRSHDGGSGLASRLINRHTAEPPRLGETEGVRPPSVSYDEQAGDTTFETICSAADASYPDRVACVCRAFFLAPTDPDRWISQI